MRLNFRTANIDKQIRDAVSKKIVSRVVGKKMQSVFEREARLLSKAFETSSEFRDLKTKLVGEFGFTPEELDNLDNILEVLQKDISVTRIEMISGPNVKELVLQWCNLDRLKEHPVAIHKLTQYDPEFDRFVLTDIVSWIEWLNDGVTVRGYRFDPTNTGKYSRSKQGIMKPTPGGLWTFTPTKVFERLPERINSGENLRKGIGLVLRGKK